MAAFINANGYIRSNDFSNYSDFRNIWRNNCVWSDFSQDKFRLFNCPTGFFWRKFFISSENFWYPDEHKKKIFGHTIEKDIFVQIWIDCLRIVGLITRALNQVAVKKNCKNGKKRETRLRLN